MTFKFNRVLGYTAMVAALMTSACGGASLEGTYSNANGFVTLDLKSGGEAVLTGMGETNNCTYAVAETTLTLTCPEEEVFEFTVHEDGSLASLGTFIGTLTKTAK